METTEITNRIAELNTIILNCLNDNSVKSAATWIKAQREREALIQIQLHPNKQSYEKRKKFNQTRKFPTRIKGYVAKVSG